MDEKTARVYHPDEAAAAVLEDLFKMGWRLVRFDGQPCHTCDHGLPYDNIDDEITSEDL